MAKGHSKQTGFLCGFKANYGFSTFAVADLKGLNQFRGLKYNNFRHQNLTDNKTR